MRWFIDFDDTLASGPITWALDYAFPQMIQDHRLECDAERFAQAVLHAQERANIDGDAQAILDELFDTMRWPHSLQSELEQAIYRNYQPALFDDALVFLERLRAAGQPIYIASNNQHARHWASHLGIAHYFHAIFTPATCPPKPHRGFWDHILTVLPDLDASAACFIGDDPWSDGVFAEVLGVECWIIDRASRYQPLHSRRPYRWVRSLRDIAIP
jgi:FMN phosphatase YigB (HAD superfamily)